MKIAPAITYGRKTYPATARKRTLQLIRDIDPNKPMVALTFDDGPSLEYTPIILDVLRENNAVATFFVLGIQAEENSQILPLITAGGNEIGNHSYNHESFTVISEERLNFQISRVQEIVKDATGYTPTLLRPPYGFVNEQVLERTTMPIILWSLDTLDWENQNVGIVYRNIFDNVKDGDIILMHDIFSSTAEATRVIIPELIRRGYQLVTVSELAQYRGVPLEPHKIYGSFPPAAAPESTGYWSRANPTGMVTPVRGIFGGRRHQPHRKP